MSRSRSRLLLSTTVLVSLALALGTVEVFLRATGQQPWSTVDRFPQQPVMHEPDAVLGWRAKPGVYRFPGYVADAPPIRITVWSDGRRASAPEPLPQARRVVFVGDSLTQGWAVSDDETFVWKMQQRFPTVELLNFGTGGYSTYQALLLLTRVLETEPPPALVVYGFADFHELRNVGALLWMRDLARHARTGQVALPYCTLDPTGALVRHAPESYPLWPLREHSAAVTLAAEGYARWLARDRTQGRSVTDQLLAELDRVTREHGGRLLVAVLFAPDSAATDYASSLTTRGTSVVDCRVPITADLLVPGEGHPSGKLHDAWADCIGRALSSLLPPS